jgi:hypothetical protein
MGSETIGKVRCGRSGRYCDVSWSPSSGEVYVSYAGWTRVGKASSAGEAMRKAEAFVYNK